jgi:S1-C subfamily serine protease
MKLREFFTDCLLLVGMVLIVLSLSFWLAGYCDAAECANCDNGLVGRGPVKYVCPICLGVGNMGSISDTAFGTNPAKTPEHGNAVAAGQDKTQDHRKAVVRIVVSDGPSVSRGSGVAIGGNRVLTAYHVVRTNSSANTPTVYFQDGTQSKAKVVKTDDDFDLALLECETVASASAKLAGSEPAGTLTVTGYGPHPSTFRESRGRIVGRARPTREHPMDHIVISTGARQGDSGGPVFNEQGEVAAILWGSRDGQTYATHAGRIQAWLADSNTSSSAGLQGTCATGKCRK